MGYKKVECPSCGSPVELGSDREFGYCSYCGAEIALDKIIVEHRGSVSMESFTNANALLDRAFIILEDRNFKDAHTYFERVLDMSPRCSRAYFGNLLCSLNCTSAEELCRTSKPLHTFGNFEKALRFADSKEAEEYKSYASAVNENYNRKLQKKEERIAALERAIVSNNIESNVKINNRNRAGVIFWLILALLLIASLIYGIIEASLSNTPGYTFESIMSVILAAPLPVLCFVRRSKLKKKVEQYNKACDDLQMLNNSLRQNCYDRDQWILNNNIYE